MTKSSSMQFLAYYLAVGPTRFAKGPHEMIIQFVFLCNLKELHTFMTLAWNQQDLIAGIAEVFDPQQEKGYYDQITRNYDEIRLWICSTQVNVSGLLSDAESRNNIRATTYDETNQRGFELCPGFMFPSQLATMMQCETEDMLPFASPALTPIFGAAIVIRYPSAPLHITANRDRHSIIIFIQNKRTPLSIQDSPDNPTELRPPMAFTCLKSEKEDFINYNGLVRTRARRKIDLFPDIHPVQWTNVPLNPKTGLAETYPNWNRTLIDSTVVLALKELRCSQIPTVYEFCFRTIWEHNRIAILRAIPQGNMMPTLKNIMGIDHASTYTHRVSTLYLHTSSAQATDISQRLHEPERQPLISRKFQTASPSQLSEYRTALGPSGALAIARFLYATRIALNFENAVDNVLQGPYEEPIIQIHIDPIPKPEDIVKASKRAEQATTPLDFNPRLPLNQQDANVDPAALILPTPTSSPTPQLDPIPLSLSPSTPLPIPMLKEQHPLRWNNMNNLMQT